MTIAALSSILRTAGYPERWVEVTAEKLAAEGVEPWDLHELWKRAQSGFHPSGLFAWWVDRGVWPKVLAPRDLPRKAGWIGELLPLVMADVRPVAIRRAM